MSHQITVEYLQAALEEIEQTQSCFIEETVEKMRRIAHKALNGEWDSP